MVTRQSAYAQVWLRIQLAQTSYQTPCYSTCSTMPGLLHNMGTVKWNKSVCWLQWETTSQTELPGHSRARHLTQHSEFICTHAFIHCLWWSRTGSFLHISHPKKKCLQRFSDTHRQLSSNSVLPTHPSSCFLGTKSHRINCREPGAQLHAGFAKTFWILEICQILG